MSGAVRILFSKPEQSSDYYIFDGVKGTTKWPKIQSALAPGGVWNFLWRHGYCAIEPDELSYKNINYDGLLFICLCSPLDHKTQEALLKRVNSKYYTIITGVPKFINQIFSTNSIVNLFNAPIKPVGLISSCGERHILSTQSSSCFLVDAKNCDWTKLGQLYLISGEKQTKHKAIFHQLDGAPIALKKNNLLIINADPFASYQSWLQGHDDLNDWLSWRSRLSWLDEHAIFLKNLIKKLLPDIFDDAETNTIGLNQNIIVLRHDLDDSRDTSFLNLEYVQKVPATHAILNDRNFMFWQQTLKNYPKHEAAFHYDTGKEHSIYSRILRKILHSKPLPILADVSRICSGELNRQIKKVTSKGLHVKTIHRHLSYIYYPEIVDAIDNINIGSSFVGGSSFFRGRILRFGALPDDINGGGVVNSPDVQFPNWYPYRVWNSSSNKLTSAFEGTCLMEADPELVLSLLESQKNNGLNNVVTLCYHPAHSKSNAFNNGGTLAWLDIIIKESQKMNWTFHTLSHVYEMCRKSCR